MDIEQQELKNGEHDELRVHFDNLNYQHHSYGSERIEGICIRGETLDLNEKMSELLNAQSTEFRLNMEEDEALLCWAEGWRSSTETMLQIRRRLKSSAEKT